MEGLTHKLVCLYEIPLLVRRMYFQHLSFEWTLSFDLLLVIVLMAVGLLLEELLMGVHLHRLTDVDYVGRFFRLLVHYNF